MASVVSLAKDLPSGIAPNKIVHLSALIYSDPIGTSAAIFRIDHFATLMTETPQLKVGLGGSIRVDIQGGINKIILDRGKTTTRSRSLFESTGTNNLVDKTPVAFAMKKTASGASYNRGVIRIVYIRGRKCAPSGFASLL
jgi:hypothetical protein